MFIWDEHQTRKININHIRFFIVEPSDKDKKYVVRGYFNALEFSNIVRFNSETSATLYINELTKQINNS